MRTSIASASLALLLSGHVSANDDWIPVAESEVAAHSIRGDTLELTKNKLGDEIVLALGRARHKDGTIDVYKWYVRTNDCENGYGKLVTLSTDGTFLYDNEFASGAGSSGSLVAARLCMFYRIDKMSRDLKGV